MIVRSYYKYVKEKQTKQLERLKKQLTMTEVYQKIKTLNNLNRLIYLIFNNDDKHNQYIFSRVIKNIRIENMIYNYEIPFYLKGGILRLEILKFKHLKEICKENFNEMIMFIDKVVLKDLRQKHKYSIGLRIAINIQISYNDYIQQDSQIILTYKEYWSYLFKYSKNSNEYQGLIVIINDLIHFMVDKKLFDRDLNIKGKTVLSELQVYLIDLYVQFKNEMKRDSPRIYYYMCEQIYYIMNNIPIDQSRFEQALSKIEPKLLFGDRKILVDNFKLIQQ